jgi:hypothetical protein
MRLKISLLGLRLGVFIVFIAWTLDKLINYKHNSGMISHYYHVEVPQWFLTALGLAELALLLAFLLLGRYKTFTYGIILFAHTVTTFVSSGRLFPPYEIHQLLYFGSIPMLAACLALFLLRDQDTLMTFEGR